MRARPAAALLLAVALGVARPAAAEPGSDAAPAAPPGVELSVLTYNIHGLPAWIAGDDPEARIPALLERAAGIDVVLLQEDFAYPHLVDEHARQPVRQRGNGRRRAWPFFQGSGLTLLSHLRAVGAPVRAAYDVCHGWFTAANDCFGHKGYLMTRLALPGGATLDVWNTHLDAGPGVGDQAVRAAQLERLAAAIERESAGEALVVGGDFNLDWDTPHERALLERFAARVGLELAALTPAGAWRSRLDYLLVRSGLRTTIEVLDARMADEFADARGAPLSDHPAILARLRVRPR